MEKDYLEPFSFQTEDIAEVQLFLTPGQMILRRFMGNKLAVLGATVLFIVAVLCFAAPLFYPYNQTEQFYTDKTTGEELRTFQTEQISTAVLKSLEKPSLNHLLGTNKMGQDMLSRLMYGGRISLLVGFVVVIVELLLGVILGGAAGYYGGLPNAVIMRLVDIISSIPFMPLMFILASLEINLNISPKYKIYYTMFMIGLIWWTGAARMVRATILSLRETEFMQAADAVGIKTRNKIFRHLIPNTLPNLIVMATLDLGSVILMESTMSYLGVGVGAPYASWGNMVQVVNDNVIMRDYVNLWLTPGLCILVVVLAFNFVGDGLRDATDPRMKGR
ncbi:MAG: ABC transporter permease [Clostridiales bacterium]|nr:ABC transporter permease [Clostridiales bacterium]